MRWRAQEDDFRTFLGDFVSALPQQVDLLPDWVGNNDLSRSIGLRDNLMVLGDQEALL